MKTRNIITTTVALLAGANAVAAGGIDRTGQPISAIFQEGDYVEFSYSYSSPMISGSQVGAYATSSVTVPALGQTSGDIAGNYSSFGAAYKRQFNEKISAALIWDQPFGADLNYGFADSPVPYAYYGSSVKLSTQAMTLLLRYQINDNFSLHGGARYLLSSGEVAMANGYTMHTSDEGDWGYVIGAAYEIPEIALRAALTYSSAITHNYSIQEYHSSFGLLNDTMEVTMPKSVNFNFQTGIAPKTLLKVDVRWVDWPAFKIAPDGYMSLSGGYPLASFRNARYSYSVGLARQLTDRLAGSFAVGYEPSLGGFAANLGPTDGKVSLSAGMKYDLTEQTAISAGVSYVWIGDAETQNPTNRGTAFGAFNDNSAVGFGMKISHSF